MKDTEVQVALERLVPFLIDAMRAIAREELRNAAPPPAEYVDVATYARRRSISETTVRLAVKDGRLPAIRIGRAVRVKADAEVAAPPAKRDAAAIARARLLGGGRTSARRSEVPS